MKRRVLIYFVSLLFLIISLSSCSVKYKRISLAAPLLGSDSEMIYENISDKTSIEFAVSDGFVSTMPVYKITPRDVTKEEFQQLCEFLEFEKPDLSNKTNTFYVTEKRTDPSLPDRKLLSDNNHVSYYKYDVEKPLVLTDEELEAEAKKVFSRLTLMEGEYEYVGVTSVQTLLKNSEEYVVKKCVSFRRLIDGTRIIGNDICDLYFNCEGLCNIEIKLFNYEKNGEIDLIPVEEVVNKVKKPDAFVVKSDTIQNFSGSVDKLKIEKIKLLFVNQYNEGCEILQPVYNLMGKAENKTGSVDVSARIIAIPEKYTFD